jgi:tellurite resistance protein
VSPARRVPPNFFGFGFGLAGLGETWRIAEQFGGAPEGVGDGLAALSALAWLSVPLAYLRFAVSDRSAFRRDLADPVVAPFLSLALVTPMLLAVLGLVLHEPGPGRLLFDVFVVLTVLLGSWLTGRWRCGTLQLDNFRRPAWVRRRCAHRAARPRRGDIGFGALSWLVVESIVSGRLYLRPILPPPPLPMLALEVALPAVASLVPAFRRRPFMPSTWSFTFAWSAVASAAMHWLNDTRPAGYPAEEYLLLIAKSVLVIAIAARTVAAACRGRLLPPDLPAGAAPAPPGRQPGTRRPATGKGLRSPWRRI